MAQAPIGLLISSLLRHNRRRSFSVDRIPSPEHAIRESRIASDSALPPVLVGAIVGLESDLKDQLVAGAPCPEAYRFSFNF